jgi:hypothetical protein
MNIHQNFPAGSIITKGLGSDVSTGMLITGFFRLGPIAITIITPQAGGSAFTGGSIPMAPGEIHDAFKPVTGIGGGSPGFYSPAGIIPSKEFLVKVNLTIRGKTIEKTYTVQKGKITRFIALINLSNKALHNINVAVSSIKRVLNNISVKFKK